MAAAFSPDGSRALTGSSDNMARFWDAATGKPIGAPLQHQGSVNAVAFSRDGKIALTGSGGESWPFGVLSNRGEARLWNVATLQQIGQALEHAGAVVAVTFGPDNRPVLTADSSGTVHVWEMAVRCRVKRPCRCRQHGKERFHPVFLRALGLREGDAAVVCTMLSA
jgi:WD40 repeat protein